MNRNGRAWPWHSPVQGRAVRDRQGGQITHKAKIYLGDVWMSQSKQVLTISLMKHHREVSSEAQISLRSSGYSSAHLAPRTASRQSLARRRRARGTAPQPKIPEQNKELQTNNPISTKHKQSYLLRKRSGNEIARARLSGSPLSAKGYNPSAYYYNYFCY